MTTKQRKPILTFAELVKACSTDEYRDFYLFLGQYGNLRSSKALRLRANRKSFYVLNEIDGSSQVLNEKSLYTRSNIGAAMLAGSLFSY